MKVKTLVGLSLGAVVIACGSHYFLQDSDTGAPLPPDKPEVAVVEKVESVVPIPFEAEVKVVYTATDEGVEAQVVAIEDSTPIPTDSGDVLPTVEDSTPIDSSSGEVLEEHNDTGAVIEN